MHHFHIDPDTLSDDSWAKAAEGARLLVKAEKKNASKYKR